MLMWSPICNYTHYSLLTGFSKPSELVAKCKANKYKACGIADYKTISGAVSFYKKCKDNGIKPIIGCTFDSFTLIAKNKDGWLDLISLVSHLDDDQNIPHPLLASVCARGNLLCIGRDESQSPITGEDFYQKTPALMHSFYTNKEDAKLHRVLLCSKLKSTLPKISKLLSSSDTPESIESYRAFFEHDSFHVPNDNEITDILLSCSDEDIDNVADIINKCEDYDILNKPMLPTFNCPNGESEEEYLKQLCREGWRKHLLNSGKVEDEEQEEKYLARFTEEFSVIKNANLFGYFLIVRDIVKFVEEKGWLSGPGRGSAAGCLISYLIDITKIDPIQFDLLFERFYNVGRNSEDHISLPDIDIDVPGKKRDEIIEYLKEKYGPHNVGQMLTFGRLQGRSALKEVLRSHEACSFSEMNAITKSIPNEADISDQLADMDEEDRSIIKWALINHSEDLRDFCFINDGGTLDGDYADFFREAISLEGTFKTQGKHAAGVVISAEKLYTVCPMVDQRSGDEKIAGLEMSDLESLGHVKFDILGINLLDKIMKVQEQLSQMEDDGQMKLF